MSPTYDAFGARIRADLKKLTPAQRSAFRTAARQFAADLAVGDTPRPALGVKRFSALPGVWELSWAADGRALFRYGDEVKPGEPHVVWLRVGTHDIFRRP